MVKELFSSSYNKTINIKKYQLIIGVIVVAISIFRVFMQMKMPYSFHPKQSVDDWLMQKMALHLYNGEYLGLYDEYTLCKDYVFSYLLALCYKFIIPYPVLMGLLNIGSACAICMAVKKYIPYVARVVMYLLLIFSPVTFADSTALRVYRNSILPYLTLLVFAGFIAFFLNKEEKGIKPLIPWIIIESISLPLFWYVKEDSIWVLPFCVVITVLALIWVWINHRDDFIKKLIAFSIPVLMTIVMGLGIATTNYMHYGVFTTNDRSHTEAAKTYSNILKIESDASEDDPVWVNAGMYEKAAEASPTFAMVWDRIKESNNANGGTTALGDLFIWKIRHTLLEMGYYTDAKETNELYGKINDELEEAFDNGSLKKDDLIHLSGLMKGMSFGEIVNCIPKAIKNMYNVSVYKNLELDVVGSTDKASKQETETFEAHKNIATQQYLLDCNTFLRHPLDYQEEEANYAWHYLGHINKIIKAFQKSGKFIDVLAVAGFIAFFIMVITGMIKKDYKRLNPFIVLCGIILSAFVASFEVESFSDYFHSISPEFYDDFIGFYSVSMYPLIDTFKYLSIIFGIKELICFIKKKNNSKKV